MQLHIQTSSLHQQEQLQLEVKVMLLVLTYILIFSTLQILLLEMAQLNYPLELISLQVLATP